MPIRVTRPRKGDALKQFIAMLYERPSLSYLRASEPWEEIADLIYGPPDLMTDRFFDDEVRQKSLAKLESLKRRWSEIRNQILQVQAQYTVRKPWGSRFDRGGRSEGGL